MSGGTRLELEMDRAVNAIEDEESLRAELAKEQGITIAMAGDNLALRTRIEAASKQLRLAKEMKPAWGLVWFHVSAAIDAIDGEKAP